MKDQSSKPNLFIQLAKRKSEALKQRQGTQFLDESQAARFPRPRSEGPQALRGRRNGQGKPS